MSYYLTDGSHVFVTGATGAGDKFGGKTVLANWWFDRAVSTGTHDMGVFFNPKGHSFVKGSLVRSLGDLVYCYQQGDRLFNYVPSGDSVASQHDKLIRTLRKASGTKIVVHDEAHEVASSEMLDWCFRQGGNVGSQRFKTGDIRSIAVSQHPWDIPESVAQNAPLKVWVGPTTPESKRYFDTMQISDAYAEIPETDPYYWTVIDGGEVVSTNKPVGEAWA
jgi:hypothetical protein